MQIAKLQINELANTSAISFTQCGAQLKPEATESDVLTFIETCDKARVHLRLAAGDILLQAANRFGSEPISRVGGDGSSADYWYETIMICRFFPESHRYEDCKHFSHYRRGIYEAHRDKSRGCLLDAQTTRRILAQACARGDSAEIVKELAKSALYGQSDAEMDKKEKDDFKPKTESIGEDATIADSSSAGDKEDEDSGDADTNATTGDIMPPVLRESVKAFEQSSARLCAIVSREKLTEDEIACIRKTLRMLNQRVSL